MSKPRWEMHADAAAADLTVAQASDEIFALGHLRDARDNVNRAIEALEAKEDDADETDVTGHP